MMQNNKIVMLVGEGHSTNILFNAINSKFEIALVIMEEKENRKFFIKRRIKKLGLVTVAGQILFQAIVVKLLNKASKKRIENIINQNGLNKLEIPTDKIKRVASINDDGVKTLLQQLNPAVIIVNGTRIISKKILLTSNGIFINTHTGITPMYRGVHGGYWALVNNDKENCGVTVHLVDAGIDTGGILFQQNIFATKEDNFVTYPYLQTAKAVPILLQAVQDALQNKLEVKEMPGRSHLWYHPTLWQYLYYRIFKKVK
jgi:folate-dependent phosphoribosylglycinamide formyltransferase PurN